MQHLELSAQVAAKAARSRDSLRDIGRFGRGRSCPRFKGAVGLSSPRPSRRAQCAEAGGACWSASTSAAATIADMRSCAVLPPRVSDLLLPLRELVAALSISERLPQIEVAVGEECTAWSCASSNR